MRKKPKIIVGQDDPEKQILDLDRVAQEVNTSPKKVEKKTTSEKNEKNPPPKERKQ